MKIFNKLICITIISVLLLSCRKAMVDVNNSVSYTINSSYTNIEYTIQVLYPENYDMSKAYPTIYLLDGDWYFYDISKFVKSNYASDVILVGIGYKKDNKRLTDYTFPQDINYANSSGGGDDYIRFLTKELIPYIENDLSVKSSETTIAGHSLGGYFALYQMLQETNPTEFDNVIAISPSLFWKDAYIFDLEKQYNSNNDTLDRKLYITIGAIEGATMNTHYDAFCTVLKNRDYKNLTFEHHRIENTSHNANAIKSIKNGISFILQ